MPAPMGMRGQRVSPGLYRQQDGSLMQRVQGGAMRPYQLPPQGVPHYPGNQGMQEMPRPGPRNMPEMPRPMPNAMPEMSRPMLNGGGQMHTMPYNPAMDPKYQEFLQSQGQGMQGQGMQQQYMPPQSQGASGPGMAPPPPGGSGLMQGYAGLLQSKPLALSPGMSQPIQPHQMVQAMAPKVNRMQKRGMAPQGILSQPPVQQ